jgi:hypothetical protein
MSARENAHRILDCLPEESMAAVERFLTELVSLDPLDRFLRLAPPDDEPETPEEQAAVEEALRDMREGRFLSHDELKRSLDLE